MPVDTDGFDKKMKALRNFRSTFPKFVQDAASYLNAKLVGSILNGAPGEQYPKPYPAGITDNVGGYVGIQTSNLRRSIGIELEDNGMVARIGQVNEALAPYHKYVVDWSAAKYGKNFYQIAIQLYGPKVAKEMFDFLKAFADAADKGQTVVYRNRFPG